MAADRKKLQAYKLYLDGKTPRQIADQLGLSASTVRSWKSRERWDDPDRLHGLHDELAAKILAEDQDPDKAQDREEAKAAAAAKGGQRKNRQRKWAWRAAQKEEEAAARKALRPLLKNDKLNDQQKLFCIYFIKSFNAVASYQRAYGCAYSTAQVNGHKALHHPEISLEIARLKKERALRAYLSAEDIVERMLAIAFGDVGDFVDFGTRWEPYIVRGKPVLIPGSDGQPIVSGRNVNYMELRDAAGVDTSLIAEIKQGKDGTSIKLHDRIRALEWLAEHLGLMTPAQKARLDLDKARTEQLRSSIEAMDVTEIEDLEALDDEIFED